MKSLTTGEVAALLGTSEPRINDLVRRGKIDPAPLPRAGRRSWEQPDIERAARALGISFDVSNEEANADAS